MTSPYTDALLGKKEEVAASLQAGFRARDFMLMTIFRGDLQAELDGYSPFERIEEQVSDRMANPPGTNAFIARSGRVSISAKSDRHLRAHWISGVGARPL